YTISQHTNSCSKECISISHNMLYMYIACLVGSFKTNCTIQMARFIISLQSIFNHNVSHLIIEYGPAIFIDGVSFHFQLFPGKGIGPGSILLEYAHRGKTIESNWWAGRFYYLR